jgi:hypothetical protein
MITLVIFIVSFPVALFGSFGLGWWRVGTRTRILLWLILCWWWIPVWAMVAWSTFVEYWQVAVIFAVLNAMAGLEVISRPPSRERGSRSLSKPR